MNYSIGVDIGGTNTVIAIINESGYIIEKTVISTDLSITPKNMIHRINSYIKLVIKKSNLPRNKIKGIGIVSPGPLDSRQGYITNPPNLHGWIDVPVKQLIEKEFSYPVRLENDANAATLAEKWIGAGQNTENFIYITVSTGIGSGIVINRKLLQGIHGNAGDIGHMVIDPSFGRCICGQYGCLESIASGSAIARHASKLMGKNLSTKDVFNLYKNKNSHIHLYLKHVLKLLGAACVTLINTFDTEKIIIGGGVTNAGTLFFTPIRDYVQKYALNRNGSETKIIPAYFKNNASVIGAAYLSFI